MCFRRILPGLVLLSMALASGPGRAAGPYAIGSSNTANIEPTVTHPSETPCVVSLFTNATFGAKGVPFSYTPPHACGSSWARVVLRTSIGLNPGVQYDRTGSITLDGVSLWFGTTSEPRTALGPHWTVETDVTRDTALLREIGAGRVLIANYQNATDTSTITASAEMLFYPANLLNPAASVPDMVIPLASNSSGDSAALGSSSAMLSETLDLPTNVEQAELDLTLQGQQNDEFWYSCVPNALSGALESCGGGAFREGEVTIDGTAAGEAPVYPLIFTGGIDPLLWEPVPGVEALDIKPFPVELTPFAAVLSNGKPHMLSVSVDGANNYFSVFGTLYVTLDKSAKSVTGGLTEDTLAGAPAPLVTTGTGKTGAGTTTHLATIAADDFTIAGYANTSFGRVATTVHQTLNFSNIQNFLIGPAVYDQAIVQGTRTNTDITRAGPLGTLKSVDERDYSLTAVIDEAIAPDGNATQTTTIAQTLKSVGLDSLDGVPIAYRDLLWTASPTDTLDISGGSITGNAGQSSKSSYASVDTLTGCDSVGLAVSANVLTRASSSTSCLAALTALFRHREGETWLRTITERVSAYEAACSGGGSQNERVMGRACALERLALIRRELDVER